MKQKTIYILQKGWEEKLPKNVRMWIIDYWYLLQDECGNKLSEHRRVELEHYFRQLLEKERERERKEIVEKIEKINVNEHICRFNDGDCVCDCYVMARQDIINKIK